MKKITLLGIACITPIMTMAHEIPVPHAHQDYVHGLLPFLQFIVLPIILGLGLVKLFKIFKRSGQP